MTTTLEPITHERDPIMDGALEAFLDFGVRRTNMAEIARRAGIRV